MVGGIFDDDPEKSLLLSGKKSGFPGPFDLKTDRLIISIGNNQIRDVLTRRYSNYNFATAIHPHAAISKDCLIAEGTVIMAGAVINAASRIGRHCIINTRSSVDHDCIVADFVHLAPGAILCGGVTIGRGTFVGAGAVIIPGVTIGSDCLIGAGAICLANLPDGVTAVGNPARIIKNNH